MSIDVGKTSPIYLNVKTVIAAFILKKLSTWNNPYLIWSI